jgi:hypothetical protein
MKVWEWIKDNKKKVVAAVVALLVATGVITTEQGREILMALGIAL